MTIEGMSEAAMISYQRVWFGDQKHDRSSRDIIPKVFV